MIHKHSFPGRPRLQQPRGHLSLRLPGRFPSGGNNSSPAGHKAIWIKCSQKPTENTLPADSALRYTALAAATEGHGMSGSPERPSIPETAPTPPDPLCGITSPTPLITSRQRCVGNPVAREPFLHQRSLSTANLFLWVSYIMLASP